MFSFRSILIISMSFFVALWCAACGDSGDAESTDQVPEPNGSVFPSSSQDLLIQPLGSDSMFSPHFSKFTTVFGVYILASTETPDSKVQHAAHVMAQYLDNNADGSVDDEAAVNAMVKAKSVLVMFKNEDEIESSGLFESDILDGLSGQDLYGSETDPDGGFDASLEEVLHLISNFGYAGAYPDAFGTAKGTRLTGAMDTARGGVFDAVPASYPEEAWYHYDDRTCDYACMASEYFYWALTSILGAQVDRCAGISVEWEPCSAEQVEAQDPAVFGLLTDSQFKLPTILPDGNYQPNP